MNNFVDDSPRGDFRSIGLCLTMTGIVCTMIGIAFESGSAFISWSLRTEFAHAIGYFGLFAYMAGVVLEFKRRGTLWHSLIGALALGVVVSVPSICARNWLISHDLVFFAGVGIVMAPVLSVVILSFAIAPVAYRLEMRWQARRSRKVIELKARWAFLLLAVSMQAGAFWYELWQQPYVAVSPHHGPRGHIECGQVVADALGIWLGYLFARYVDSKPVVRRTPNEVGFG